MKKRHNAYAAGFGLAESCRCTTKADESWHELEAYPEQGWTRPPPAFLAESEDWSRLYNAGVTYQDGVRMLLGPEGESLTDPEVDQILERITDSMEPAQAAEFLSGVGRALQGALPALGQAAKVALPIVGQVAQVALPIAGGAIGSFVAPGIGTALGGALGGVAGNLVGQATAPRPAPPRQRTPVPGRPSFAMPRPRAMPFPQGMSMPRTTGTPAAMGIPGMQTAMQMAGATAEPQSSAAQQLLGLLNNPQLLGGLANAALGGAGAMPAGGASLAPLLNSLASLAGEAAAEVAGESVAESEYADGTSALAHRLIGAVQGARR
ncbi:MAG: hypothetical protein ING16_17920 [Roseomonas sp.]|nr:hypothetical protein [Roseomonas sp.]